VIKGNCRAITCRRVLLESERNIGAKLGRATLLSFYEGIGSADLELVEDPDPGEIGEYAAITDPKDAHVLAGAAKGRADVLLTLDRRHMLTRRVMKAGLPFAVMTPGEFLRRLV
jgi:hypothetical protein